MQLVAGEPNDVIGRTHVPLSTPLQMRRSGRALDFVESFVSKMAPKAFILMPFASDFDEVYDYLIRELLSEAGYEVSRADDILNQRNILEDVVQSIVNADLVIADLTTSNPNVYYELGLAHALEKRVVLIAQSLDEIPFDLRPYRIVTYNTHFAQMQKARQELQTVVKGVLSGEVQFGSPISDFTTSKGNRARHSAVSVDQTVRDSADDRGLLDYQADLEDSMNTISDILTEVGSRLNTMTPEIVTASERITGSDATSPKKQRSTVRALAKRVDEYAQWLGESNEQYKAALSTMDSSLDVMLSGEFTGDQSAKADLLRFVENLREVESGIESGRTSFVGLADTMDALPRIEREFNRAKNRMANETKILADNIDQTAVVLARTRNAVKTFLEGTI